MTTDPFGQYHSPYLAMGNNPVNTIDPNGGVGLDCILWALGGIIREIPSFIAAHAVALGSNIASGIASSLAGAVTNGIAPPTDNLTASIGGGFMGDTDPPANSGERELTSSDIQSLSKAFGSSPSGQDVINFVSNFTSANPNTFVTGKTLSSSAPNITQDARISIQNINQVSMTNGRNISVSGATNIDIMKGLLSLKISNGASFNISTLNNNQVIIDVTGIKVGWFNFNKITINPNAVVTNIGGINKSFDLK